MKNFILFLVLVFSVLSGIIFFKQQKEAAISKLPVLKIYGSSSFISQWGPGPWLKETFEKTCQCRVEFYDSADSTILLQRLKAESRNQPADLVIGMDQYDLEHFSKELQWKSLSTEKFDFDPLVTAQVSAQGFAPYNWGVLSFVFKKSKTNPLPRNLDDLLKSEFSRKIALQDPRMSSPGLQFLLWLVQVKGEEGAFQYLKELSSNIHSYSSSWSKAYGLFSKGQAETVFSYSTSSLYHLIEEKTEDYVASEFAEGHPVQFEFVGIPEQCKNCDLAQKFVDLMLTVEGQKMIMNKNYMFPVIKGVKDNSPFASIPSFKLVESKTLPSFAERDRLLKKWASLRREQ